MVFCCQCEAKQPVLLHCACACGPFLNCVHLGFLVHIRCSPHHQRSATCHSTSCHFLVHPSVVVLTIFATPCSFPLVETQTSCLALLVVSSSHLLIWCFVFSGQEVLSPFVCLCFCPNPHTTKFFFCSFLLWNVRGLDDSLESSKSKKNTQNTRTPTVSDHHCVFAFGK